MNPDSGLVLGDSTTGEMTGWYHERVASASLTAEEVLGDRSRLTSPHMLLSLIEEVLSTFHGYPSYESKADHLLQSFRSTLEQAGPLENEFLCRHELFQLMQLASCIRPLRSVDSTLSAIYKGPSSGVYLQMIFDHVHAVLSEYEYGGVLGDSPSYDLLDLSASMAVISERANADVVLACHVLIERRLTFHEPLAHHSWHAFAITLCQKAMQGGRILDAHHVWLLLKSHAPEHPTETLPAAARAEHELAVALFQVARDCFDPATRSPVGSK